MNWEYIAGFYDGEGNCQINPIRNDGKIKAYQLLVRLYSTNREVLEKINQFIDYKGHIYTKKATRNNPERNVLYEFVLSKKESCLFFLQNIFPHLIIKKAQIGYLFQKFDFLDGRKGGGHTNIYFDLDKFRSFNNRKGTEKFIKNHSIPATPNN